MQDTVSFEGILGEGSSLEGDLRFEGPFRVDGRVTGSVVATALVVVGPPGQVQVTTFAARSLVVAGSVTGHLTISERLEVLPGGRVSGRVRLGRPALTVHLGGRIDGDVEMLLPENLAEPSAEVEPAGV